MIPPAADNVSVSRRALSAVFRSGRLRFYGAAVVAMLALGFAAWLWRDETRALAQQAMTLGPWPAFAALVVLPLVGFPLSVLALAAGLRFGLGPALLLLAPAIVFHLVFGYAVGRRWLAAPLQRGLARYTFTLPRAPAGEAFSVALLVNLVPGPPYAAKIYLLALSDLPFRAYFFAGLGATLLGVSSAILAGDFVRTLSPLRGGVFAVYFVLISFLTHRLIRRLRRRAVPPASAARD